MPKDTPVATGSSVNAASDPLVSAIYNQLVESACVDVSFKMHRMIKTGQISAKDLLVSTRMRLYPGLYETEKEAHRTLQQYATELPATKRRRRTTTFESDNDENDSEKKDPESNDAAQLSSNVVTRNQHTATDIWGVVHSAPPNENVECSVCNRMVSTVRFAPHLDKCMQIGTMSRAAAASASRK